MHGAADEAALVRRIEDALAASGERVRLQEAVRARLEASGWLDIVRAEAEREVNAHAHGTGSINANLSPQEICSAVVPRVLDAVPAQVRSAARDEIRQFLDEHVRLAP